MFDLIDECGKELKRYGYQVKSTGKFGVSEASLNIEDEKQAKTLQLSEGRYFILSSPFLHQLGGENEEYLSKLISAKVKILLKDCKIGKDDKILLACLGNFDIEGDRLGKEVFDRVDLLDDGSASVYKFCPNIFLYTGIETVKMIKMLVVNLKIQCVIIIDSLTTNSLARLGTSFQLSSSGMTPGSGVNRFGSPINEKVIKAKCISIGVPFMINSASLIGDVENETILVCKDVSSQIACAGRVIANALKEALR